MAQKKEFNIFSWVLIVVAVLLVVYFFTGTKIVTRYIKDQIPVDYSAESEELTEEEREYYENRILFEAQYFDNSSANGIQLQELKLDYFVKPTLLMEDCRSTGMQYLGDYELETDRPMADSHDTVDNRVVEDFYYYDTTVVNGNVISWNGGNLATILNRNTDLIVKIDDKPYKLNLNGLKFVRYEYFLWWQVGVVNYYYQWDDVFYDVMNAIKTNSKGYGTYYINLNLSNCFTVYAYDEVKGRFDNGVNINTEFFTFAYAKIHYYPDGATLAQDSFFGNIANDNEYSQTYNNLLFDANGGSGEMQNLNVETGSQVIAPACVFLKAGSTFAGWNTSQDGTGTSYDIGDSITLSEDITLYAQWDVSVYTLIFDKTTGSGSMVSQTFVDGVPQEVNSCTLSRTNYSFVKWFLYWDSSKSISDGAEITITSIVENNVEFIKIIVGETEYILPNTEVMLTDEQGHNTIVSNSNFHEITIYAYWQVLYYVGTYNANGATIIVDENGIASVSFGGATYSRSTFTYSSLGGLNFNAWHLSCQINDVYNVFLQYDRNGDGKYYLKIDTIHPPLNDIVVDFDVQKI